MTTPDNQPPIDLSDVRAADPVRMADLPTASSPDAQRLLHETMRSAMPDPNRSAGLRSRLPVLGAVAAAVAMIAAGFAILSPSSTPTALASVKAAAQEAAVADSGRIVTEFSMSGSADGESGTVAGSAEMTFNGDDITLNLDVDEVPGELQGDEAEMLSGLETRLVDGVVYVRGGPAPDWIGFEVPELMLDQADQFDPRTILDEIQTLVEAEEIGTDSIDGIDVTLYRSVVDLDDPSINSTGWLAGLEGQLDLETDGTITVDLAVDSEGRMRSVDVAGQLTEAQDGDGSATFSISTEFSDFNEIDRIVAPEGVVPNSLLNGLSEGMTEDLDGTGDTDN